MSKFWKRLKQVGPGAVVAAAFIGPGTVTTCTVSGASYGYTLLWALLFSTISVIVLQSMASKLGIVKKVGLGEALREKYTGKGVRILLAILVIGAVFIGNVAYETGNISGGILGLQAIWPSLGKMKPNFGEVLKGLFVPRVPQMNRAWFYVTGLIGTTVVPYNIYLHASSSAKKWGHEQDKNEALSTSLTDSILSIGLGGIISMCIVITAAVCYDGSGTAAIANGKAMAEQLKPILGNWATVAFGIGLFAAGMSSAITAPLAAAFASSGILGWGEDMKKKRFMAIWGIVLLFGLVAVCTIGASPTEIILFAQAANAFLLPITAILLMIVCNDKKYMDGHNNGIVINILGVIVLALTLLIAFKNMTGFTESFMKLING